MPPLGWPSASQYLGIQKRCHLLVKLHWPLGVILLFEACRHRCRGSNSHEELSVGLGLLELLNKQIDCLVRIQARQDTAQLGHDAQLIWNQQEFLFTST